MSEAKVGAGSRLFGPDPCRPHGASRGTRGLPRSRAAPGRSLQIIVFASHQRTVNAGAETLWQEVAQGSEEWQRQERPGVARAGCTGNVARTTIDATHTGAGRREHNMFELIDSRFELMCMSHR